MTGPIRTGAIAKDSDAKKFATTSHAPFPFNIKEVRTLTWVRWCFGTLAHHLLSLLVSQIKSLFLAPTTHLLTYWPIMGESYEPGLGNSLRGVSEPQPGEAVGAGEVHPREDGMGSLIAPGGEQEHSCETKKKPMKCESIWSVEETEFGV